MLYLATYFDRNYLSRGLVLYHSLKRHTPNFTLFVLCLDDHTYEYFQNNATRFPEIKLLRLQEIEDADPELKASKSNRSKIEYYFTLSPCMPLYLMKKFALPHICTLDADILFLSDPQPLFDQLQHFSVIITPHKFSLQMKFLEKFGRYNVSFQVFKNDETGMACLTHWRAQCIDWCGDQYDEEKSRFADQKYLDEWPVLYPGQVKELQDATSGLAPWNLNNYQLSKKSNDYFSNGERVIFYHFHHFKLFGKGWASNGLVNYEVQQQEAIDLLYLDYWNLIEAQNPGSVDLSQRADLSQKLMLKLLNEPGLYYKRSREKIYRIDMRKFPNLLRRILLKLYA